MCSRFQDVRIAKDPRDKFKPKELFTRESLAELDKIVAAKRARLEENIPSQELQAVRQAEEDKEADRLAQEMEQRRIDRAKAAEDRIARDKEKEEQEEQEETEPESLVLVGPKSVKCGEPFKITISAFDHRDPRTGNLVPLDHYDFAGDTELKPTEGADIPVKLESWTVSERGDELTVLATASGQGGRCARELGAK